MKNFILSKFTYSILLVAIFYSALSRAQCTFGDQSTYGSGQWIGYVYSGLDSGNPPAMPTTYNGYVTQPEIFDQNLGAGALSSATMCGSFDTNFMVIYKMQKTFAEGFYTFTVGGDDGYRLSFDGGNTFAANLSDWADHGYQTKTATYFLSGSVDLVYEYFEHGGDSRVSFTYALASCNATAPTTISGTTAIPCNSSTTLTASGGTAGTGSTYQWGTGTIGENIIAGQTSASITVYPASDTYYWVRRVNGSPCSGYTDGVSVLVTITNPPEGDPDIFGDNVWNVYSYNGTDLDLTGNTYLGFYIQSTLGFNTQNIWPKAESPSSYSGWEGCTVPVNDFTFVHKRQGFPCGRYIVTMTNWDDSSRLYINGEVVWSAVGWSGGVGSQVIGTYDLDENSTIELRTEENGGDANAQLTLTPTGVATAPSSVSGNSVFCTGGTMTITANGGALGINGAYQWGTGETAGNNIIEGETGSSITIAPSETTTYWVRIVNTVCSTYTAEATFQVTVPTPVVYNGVWSDTPTIDTPVIIENDLTIDEDIEMCSCQVVNNAVMTVAEEVNITVKGKLTVAPTAAMTLENKASLLQTDDIDNEGSINVVRNSSMIMRLDYTLWSSPVEGQQLLEFSPMTLENRFYAFNTPENLYYHISPEEDFELAEGYLIRAPNNHPTTPAVFTGMFTGTPHNGTITKPLEYTGIESSYSAIGNPYPSPISATEFINTNSSVIEGTLWFWRKTNNPDETTYCTLTTLGFTANAAPGGTNEYSYDPIDKLNTGQGFFVNTIAEGNITFTNDMRLGDSSNQFFRMENQDSDVSRLWLNLSDTGNNSFSQIMIGYTPQATTGYDNTIDGRSIADGPLKLYSLVNDDIKLAIQGRPSFENTDSVILGYSATTAGEMKFEIDRRDGIFAQGQKIYLIDNFLNITYNISENSYIFVTEEGTFNDRFEIIYTIEALGTDFVDLPDEAVVFCEDNKVKVYTSQQIQSVTLYDLTGRVLYESDNINNNEFSSTYLNIAQQVIIARVTLQNRQIISKKIMVD
ncbi:T9SS sorting signal type C domain-containing protein [Flavobacterium sp. LaA7.5]|nr:T9SS sorting signal type C domain-containing protein [Flavobacterium salilacus subsp. altitudinum]